VFAQVATGNAASLRAFLACGFVPIGSEVLIEQHEREPDVAPRPHTAR
jgi:RimJ/RimL family protein N-acetyltransferase